MDAAASIDGRLILADGTCFRGVNFGAEGEGATSTGEVVFSTAMTGYQEALSDPSFTGQILVLTAAEVGNYGINDADLEAARPCISGLVVRDYSRIASNYRASGSLGAWLAHHSVPAICGLDTRALVRLLRSGGVVNGVICCDPSQNAGDLRQLLADTPSMAGCDVASRVTPATPGTYSESLGAWLPRNGVGTSVPSRQLRVVALDCGAKRNIYRNLTSRNCEVVFVPLSTPASEIRALRPDGLFVSNGPGDPAAVQSAIDCLRELIGEFPTFGICLGHQLLALAIGAKTWKLKFGHRGANQPVRNVVTGRVEITSQNHGFAVDSASLEACGGEVTHIHLNDGTCAGFRLRDRPVFSVQYHPEASPGPHDSDYLFDAFIEMMETRKPLSDEIFRDVQGRPAELASAAGR
ncbi:MAG: glutamine-hydrolyzing carbamoyl-phosphate synthase small subunit [Planctomycetota bacterium]|nr:glutamine-hydrolyzing carbamoyl-phosphate synthase small subunit [Planctomycetota bacterium]